VRIYYGSGTVDRIASGQLADAVECVMSYQKSDSVSRRLFLWRTILPNFIPVCCEMMEPLCFFWRGRPNKKKTTMTSVYQTRVDQFMIQKCEMLVVAVVCLTSVGELFGTVLITVQVI